MMDAVVVARRSPDEEIEDGAARGSRRDQQVQRVLDAAKICFVRSGFQGASMHHICAEAGMSPGALYRYFPSKEAIIEAIAAADRRQDVEILAHMNRLPSLLDGMVAAGMAHIRYIHESGNAPLFVEIRAEAMRNEAVRQSSSQCIADVDSMFRTRLQTALMLGEIDPVVEIDALLPIMMSMGEGLAMSDLPGKGVPLDAIESALRAMLQALLRPRKTSSQPNSD